MTDWLVLLLVLAIASPIAAYRIETTRQMAEQEADTARAMLAFLRDDLLSVADPFAGNTERPRGRNLTLLAAVNLAARNVRQRFPDQPLVEAGIRVTLWQVYFALGDLDRAEEHIQRALELYDAAPDARELQRIIQDAGHIHGEAHPAALAAKSGLSDIYYQEGPWDDAIRLRH